MPTKSIIEIPVLDRISSLIRQQLPDFVRANHENFIRFLELFYEWLEQNGNANERIINLLKHGDIDQTIDQFINDFKCEFFNCIPDSSVVDKRILTKKIKEYYLAKGSEKAYEFLFRILFDEPVELRFPANNILRVSDGTWSVDKKIRLTSNGNPSAPEKNVFDWISKQIQGDTSGAVATVENIHKFNVGPSLIFEVFLSNIEGTFLKNENVFIQGDIIPILKESVHPIFVKVQIINGGTNYTEKTAIPVSGGSGIEAQARIGTVSSGPIESIQIINGGTNYQVGQSIIFNNSATQGSGAVAFIKNVNGTGSIIDIDLISGGSNYKLRPLVSAEITTGSGAILQANGSIIGSIKTVEIQNVGLGYNTPPILDLSTQGDGNAAINGISGGFVELPGRFVNTRGHLDSDKFIQDSRFFQAYSYVVRTGLSLNTYKDVLKQCIHPAGEIFFGEVLITSKAKTGVLSAFRQIILEIIKIINLQFTIRDILKISMQNKIPICGPHLGFTSKSLEREKFKFFPDPRTKPWIQQYGQPEQYPERHTGNKSNHLYWDGKNFGFFGKPGRIPLQTLHFRDLIIGEPFFHHVAGIPKLIISKNSKLTDFIDDRDGRIQIKNITLNQTIFLLDESLRINKLRQPLFKRTDPVPALETNDGYGNTQIKHFGNRLLNDTIQTFFRLLSIQTTAINESVALQDSVASFQNLTFLDIFNQFLVKNITIDQVFSIEPCLGRKLSFQPDPYLKITSRNKLIISLAGPLGSHGDLRDVHLGPTYHTIEREKFKFENGVTSASDSSIIKHFKDICIGIVINYPSQKFNIVPDSFLRDTINLTSILNVPHLGSRFESIQREKFHYGEVVSDDPARLFTFANTTFDTPKTFNICFLTPFTVFDPLIATINSTIQTRQGIVSVQNITLNDIFEIIDPSIQKSGTNIGNFANIPLTKFVNPNNKMFQNIQPDSFVKQISNIP